MRGITVKNTDLWSWVKTKAEKIKTEAYSTHPDGEMYSFPKYQLIEMLAVNWVPLMVLCSPFTLILAMILNLALSLHPRTKMQYALSEVFI